MNKDQFTQRTSPKSPADQMYNPIFDEKNTRYNLFLKGLENNYDLDKLIEAVPKMTTEIFKPLEPYITQMKALQEAQKEAEQKKEIDNVKTLGDA